MDKQRKKILKLVESRGISLKAVSEAIGKNHAYLHQYIYRGSPKALPERERYTLAKFLDIAETEIREPALRELSETGGNYAKPPLIARKAPSVDATLAAQQALKELGRDPSIKEVEKLAVELMNAAEKLGSNLVNIDLARWYIKQ